MSDVKLVPCPFCGGEAKMEVLGGPKSDHRTIVCTKCKCDLHWQITEDLAIAAWNTRALTPKQQAAEEMAKVLERFNQYYESDFIRVSADDGRTLAEQMHSMRVAVDAYAALAKAGQQ